MCDGFMKNQLTRVTITLEFDETDEVDCAMMDHLLNSIDYIGRQESSTIKIIEHKEVILKENM